MLRNVFSHDIDIKVIMDCLIERRIVAE